jgi:hypothetical protein
VSDCANKPLRRGLRRTVTDPLRRDGVPQARSRGVRVVAGTNSCAPRSWISSRKLAVGSDQERAFDFIGSPLSC